MQTKRASRLSLTLPAALGLTLLTAAGPVWAQVTKADAMSQASLNQPAPDVFPPDYPYAAPGGLDLFHFTDYTMVNIAPGSAHDARMEMQRMATQRYVERTGMGGMNNSMPDSGGMMNGMMMTANGVMAAPGPVDYPYSAPGGLDLYHFTDFTRTETAPGSAFDARVEMERQMLQKNAGMMGVTGSGAAMMANTASGMNGDMSNLTDAELMVDPFPPDYPYAAPGGLDLFHFTDYTMTATAPGSAFDARMEKRRQLTIRHEQRMKDSGNSMNTGNPNMTPR